MPESTDKPQKASTQASQASQQKASAKDAARRAAKKAKRQRKAARAAGPTPQWYKYVMFGLMIVGLLWIITFYVTQGLFPFPQLGNWNIMIGFAVAIVGFLMTLGWKGK